MSNDTFNGLALEIFRYQASENILYSSYLSNLGVDPARFREYEEIPFLPIGFFKSQRVVSGTFEEEACFLSSGTTMMQPASHCVKDLGIYEESFNTAFRMFYGDPAAYRILALLPSYLEREGSSLVYMVDHLIRKGKHIESGFFLDNFDLLAERLQELKIKGFKTMLIGVSFALLDFAEEYNFPLGEHITLMETGGMKGRKEEITRAELHQRLMDGFKIGSVHSEYGMTELLSQAYSSGNGRFLCPPWMKVLVRDIQDPFTLLPDGETGALNIIDLANIHSCSFIETQDIGKVHPDGSFEVLGRTDHSDIRGCSLLLH